MNIGCRIDLSDVAYSVGQETVLHRDDSEGLPARQESLFNLMERNMIHVGNFFFLPSDAVVEVGWQIAI